jgi:magnesium chelatase subunit D
MKPESARRRGGGRLGSSNARRGRYVRAVSARTTGAKIALDATLRATAAAAETGQGGSAFIQTPVLRFKRFKQKTGTLFIFAVDASGSMALNRIAQAKGALVRLLQQSYIKRDRVALVCFRGGGADVMLKPSGSVARAKRILDSLSIGGATPLASGLKSALEIAQTVRRQSVERIVLLLFTDGRANVSMRIGERSNQAGRGREIDGELEQLGASLQQALVTTIVVDTQNRFTSGGEGQRLAEMIAGRYVYLPAASPSGEQFTSLVRQAGRP